MEMPHQGQCDPQDEIRYIGLKKGYSDKASPIIYVIIQAVHYMVKHSPSMVL